MIIDHFNGSTDCQSDAEIAALLTQRDAMDENEFWLSPSDGFPCLVLSVSHDRACLHYFAVENDPGCQSSGYGQGLDPDGLWHFHTTNGEACMIDTTCVLPLAEALTAVWTFIHTGERPETIRWESLAE